MTARFVLLRAAERDLESITEYIGRDNPGTALQVARELRALMTMLAEHPGIGHLRTDLTQEPDVLFVAKGNFQIIYLADTSPLQVLSVLWGGRDIVAVLAERTREMN